MKQNRNITPLRNNDDINLKGGSQCSKYNCEGISSENMMPPSPIKCDLTKICMNFDVKLTEQVDNYICDSTRTKFGAG